MSRHRPFAPKFCTNFLDVFLKNGHSGPVRERRDWKEAPVPWFETQCSSSDAEDATPAPRTTLVYYRIYYATIPRYMLVNCMYVLGI